MADICIFVSRRGRSRQVKLRDSQGHNPGNNRLTTNVEPGDRIIWMIDPDDNSIFSLEGITRKKRGRNNFLRKLPEKQEDGTYVGIVVDDPDRKWRGRQQSYDVSFRLEENGPIITDDPKLKMKK